MTPALLLAAQSFQGFAEAEGWSLAFVGGLAVALRGESRTTQDFDVCLFTGFGGEQPIVRRIVESYESRDADPQAFAARYRLLRIRHQNGTPGDIMMGALPFEESLISRATAEDFGGGLRLRIATPEDLIVMKCFAGRDRDWLDVTGIIARHIRELDLDYIRTWLPELLDIVGRPESMARLEALLGGRR